MKTADQPVQRPPAALTRSSCRAEWIGTAQDGTSQQAPRTDVDASAELSDREKFVRALSRDSAEGAPRGKNRESSGVMRRRQVKRLGYQAHHIRSLHFRIYLPVTRFGCGDNRRIHAVSGERRVRGRRRDSRVERAWERDEIARLHTSHEARPREREIHTYTQRTQTHHTNAQYSMHVHFF